MNKVLICGVRDCKKPLYFGGRCYEHVVPYDEGHEEANREFNLKIKRMERKTAAEIKRERGLPCKVTVCKELVFSKGLCRKHYNRWHNRGKPKDIDFDILDDVKERKRGVK